LSWLTIAPTRTLTLTPVVDDPVGTQTVRLYVKFTGDASYGANDYYEFTVDILECDATIDPGTPSITNIVYEVGMVQQQTTAFPEYTFSPGCDYTLTYEGFQSDGSALPTGVTFDGTTRVFTVSTTSSAAAGVFTIMVRASVDSVAVNKDESLTFSVDIRDNCKNDVVTITDGTTVADFSYYFTTAVTTTSITPPTFVQTQSQCPLTCSLLEDGTTTIDGDVIKNFDNTDGSFDVETNDEATYDKTTKTMKITCTSDLSQQGASGAASDEFVVTLKNECWDATLGGLVPASLTPALVLWASHSMSFTAFTSSLLSTQCGDIVYTLNDGNLPANDVYSLSGLAVVGQPTAIDPWVGTHTYTITAQQGNYASSTTATITMTISNPCTGTVIDTTPVLNAMSASMLGTDDTEQVADITDSIDAGTINPNTDKCGVKTYTLFENDGATDPSAYISIDANRLITLSPPLGTTTGTFTIQLHITLPLYSKTSIETFQITISNCIVLSITKPTIANKDHIVDSGADPFTHTAFVQVPNCQYAWTLVAEDVTTSASPVALTTSTVPIKYNSGTLTFTLDSTLISEIALYNIKLTATHAGTGNGVETSVVTFNVNVFADCNNDVVTLSANTI